MSRKHLHRNMIMTRKRLILTAIAILLIGLCMGWGIFWAINGGLGVLEMLDPSLCMIAFALIVLITWLPMFVASSQVYDITMDSIRIIPAYPWLRKWQVLGYLLCNDTMEPFIRVIPLANISSGTFCVERHVGLYGLSRYTFLLHLVMEKEKLIICINPMDNGILLPSGRGGIVLGEFLSREEIFNLLVFLEKNGVRIEDPYQLREALKDESIELYDYLEALNIKVKY